MPKKKPKKIKKAIKVKKTKKAKASKKKPKPKSTFTHRLGAPSIFTQKIADEIIERMIGGESLLRITKDKHMPHIATVLRWLNSDEVEKSDFCDNYARAKELQAEGFYHKMQDVIEEDIKFKSIAGAEVQRNRLRVDTYKWILGRMFPKKYGDFMRNEVSGADGGPLAMNINPKDLTDAQLAAIIKRHSGKGGKGTT